MTIGRQLLFAFFTLTLTLFGLFGFALYRGFEQQVKAEARAAITAQGQLMVALLEQSPFEKWEEQIKRAGLVSVTRITVLDQNGMTVLDSKGAGRVLGTHAGFPPSVSADPQRESEVEFGYVPPEESLPGERPSVLSVSLRLPVNGKYTISMTRSLLAVELELEAIRFVLSLAGLLMLAITAMGGFLLSRWLSQPLDKLVRLTEQYGRGRFEATEKITGAREMVVLSERLHMMAEKLAARERRLESYVSDASHEFRTPIASLKTLLEALLGGASESAEKRQRFLELMSTEVHRLEDLTERLLLLHRLEEGQKLEASSLDLGELVTECAEGMEVRCPESGPMIVGDPVLLRQVVLNLLQNARTATANLDDPGIAIVVTEDGTVEVTDNGVGVPEESLDKIFDRFYRVEEDRSRRTGGSGLGLPLCKLIVERHGGTMRVQSKRAEGSSFSFWIPTKKL